MSLLSRELSMSVVQLENSGPVPAGASWTLVGTNLWVASTRGEFIGTVEQIGDGFIGCDGQAVEVGRFADLDTAKRQVLHPETRGYERRRRNWEHDDLKLARVTAAVGVVVFIASLALVAAELLP
jgi:hypothetical protein